VARGLGDEVALILDGGAAAVGVESTIVSLLDTPRLLRPGGLAREDVEAALGARLVLGPAGQPDQPVAPGQLTSHYAPGAPLRMEARVAEPGEVLIGFGAVPGDVSLSPSGDLVEAAARLFQVLHDLDRLGQPIAVAPIPEVGLGLAINDRLRRAAAPRPAQPSR
ncbi:MAG: Sua5 family C-terminal domain-containing protein, partial [Pseudomonadota bacterium]